MMFRGLYDTTRVALDSTVEFFAYRPPQPPSAASDQQPRSGRRSSADNTVARRDLTPVRDPIARLTRECASLREKLEAVTSSTTNNQHGHMRRSSTQTASSSTTTANPIRRQLDDARKELSRARIENARLEDRCRNLETALQEAQSRLKELSSKSAGKPHLQKALTRRGGRQGQASQDCSDDSDFSSDAEADEDRAKRKIDDVFLTRTDSWSGAQVLQAVHDLNSEILQFSAAAVETCEFDEKPHHSTKLSQAKNDTSSRLGDNIAKVLSSADHSQDPILVQLALQGCLASCIARALTVFCLGFPSKHDSVLSQIYTHMYSSVPQPTSSRWRALTHRHIHSMYPYLADYSANDLAETMCRWAADVFFISGCASPDNTRQGFKARFGEQVLRLARTVSDLAQLIREEIMSTNFDVIVVDHGDRYDPRRMSDAFGEYGPSRGNLLVSTELGLRCTTRKSKTDVEQRLLLRPKIVLDSVLDLLQ